MHINYPIHIIDIDGTVYSYDEENARRFARTIQRYEIVLQPYHVQKVNDFEGRYSTLKHRYIARDDHGQIITNEDWPFAPRYWHSYQSSKAKLHAQALGLPIPYTSCYKGGPWKSHTNHISENRRQAGHAQQLDGLIVAGRAKPLKRIKPSPDWDTPHRERPRCWKKHRRTQWKQKAL